MVSGMVDKSVLFLCSPTVGCFLSQRNTFYVGDVPAGCLKHTLIALMCLKNSLVEHSLDVVRILIVKLISDFSISKLFKVLYAHESW